MSRPRILVVHNRYQQRGGEDSVVEAETALLSERGHAVKCYERHNDAVTGMNKLELLGETLWSRRASFDIKEIIASFRPDIIHFHNTFPLISPAAYWAAASAGVPIVQTLHNYRLMCIQAMLLREEKVCEDCVGKLPWRGVARKCYRGSLPQSGVAAAMLGLHRALGTYRDKVTRYIALNKFCRDKFVEGGLPAEKIVIKPNFVDIDRSRESQRSGGLFVGRLSAEKGILTLVAALDRLTDVTQLPDVTIDVVGTGPEQARIAAHPRIRASGWLDADLVCQRMRQAAYLVMPSIWYEAFSVVLLEAFACGLPIIASRIGTLAEVVEDGKTGLLFEAGSAESLANSIRWAEQNRAEMRRMGENARAEYEEKYTPEKNYRQLMAIYEEGIAALNRGDAAAA